MIPRKRIEQKQTSRILMRTKYFRDVIFGDKYTNAIMMKTKDEGEASATDKIVWARYPKKAAIGFLNSGSYIGSHDLNYAIGHYTSAVTGQRTGTIIKLDDIVVYANAYSLATVWVTKDGLIWKRAKYNGSYDIPFSISDERRVGKRSTGTFSCDYNNSIIYCTTSTYEEDENGEWIITRKSTSLNTITEFGEILAITLFQPIWIGNTRHGSLLAISTKVNSSASDFKYRILEVNEDSQFTYKSDLPNLKLYDEYGELSDSRYFAINNGNVTMFVYIGKKRNWAISEYVDGSCIYNIVVAVTSNFGLTFSIQEIFHYSGTWYGRSAFYRPYDIFYRNGYYHVVVVDGAYNVHHFRAEARDQYESLLLWQEIEHAPYQDIELVSGCGALYVSEPLAYQVRLHYTDNAEYNSSIYPNIRLRNCMYTPNDIGLGNRAYSHLDSGYLNVFFEDGELSEDTGICFECSGYNIYMEHPFENSEKSFAVQLRSYFTYEQEEPLKDGDYCYAGDGPGPRPEPEIPYWNPYTRYYPGDVVMYTYKWECLVANKRDIPPEESIYWTKKED